MQRIILRRPNHDCQLMKKLVLIALLALSSPLALASPADASSSFNLWEWICALFDGVASPESEAVVKSDGTVYDFLVKSDGTVYDALVKSDGIIYD